MCNLSLDNSWMDTQQAWYNFLWFSLQGYMKSKVFKNPVNDLVDLKTRIEVVIGISKHPCFWDCYRFKLRSSTKCCIQKMNRTSYWHKMTFFSLSSARNYSFPPIAVLLYKTFDTSFTYEQTKRQITKSFFSRRSKLELYPFWLDSRIRQPDLSFIYMRSCIM